MRRLMAALGAGFAGAVSLKLLNALPHGIVPNAPRLELLGEPALKRLTRLLHARPLRGRKLARLAMVSDLVANTLVYAALFAGRPRPWRRGMLGAALTGAAATAIAPLLGIEQPLARRRSLPPLTLARHLGAGAAASALHSVLATKPRRLHTQELPFSRAVL